MVDTPRTPISVIGFFVLGITNGAILGGLKGYANGGTAYNLFIMSIFGMLSIFVISIIGRVIGQIFPRIWGPQNLIVMNFKSGTAWGSYMGAVVVGGAANGIIYYLISDMGSFTQAGWIGNMVAGGLAFFFYTLLAPFVSALVNVAA